MSGAHPHESISREEKMQKLSFNQNWLFGGKVITLPHDAQITEKRGENTSGGGHGYFPGGVYTYEKTFTVPSIVPIAPFLNFTTAIPISSHSR